MKIKTARTDTAGNGLHQSTVITISQVKTKTQIAAVQELFREYTTWAFILYKRIVLDSYKSMKKAHALYQAVGFQQVNTPADFPKALKPIVVFMECDISSNHSIGNV